MRRSVVNLAWGLALVAAMPWARADAPVAARLLPDKSQVQFVSKQMGVPVEGRFGRFSAQVAFDPRKPESGSIRLRIDTGSATLGVPEADAELPKAAWFDSATFPQADFASTAIKGLGNGRFEVAGHEPLVVLDGAHNADALRALARTLDEEFTPVGSRLVVAATLQGRDVDTTVSALADRTVPL